nr:MAG TPA: hypothetical protein [Caudoviricetes sp.]
MVIYFIIDYIFLMLVVSGIGDWVWCVVID